MQHSLKNPLLLEECESNLTLRADGVEPGEPEPVELGEVN